jgi:hypothetical protein
MRIAEVSWTAVQEVIQKRVAAIILGSFGEHGPHVPDPVVAPE